MKFVELSGAYLKIVFFEFLHFSATNSKADHSLQPGLIIRILLEFLFDREKVRPWQREALHCLRDTHLLLHSHLRWFCRQNSLFPSLLENVSGYTGGYYNTTNISDPMLRTGVSLIKRKLVIYLSRLFPPAHNMKSLILSLVPATRYFPSQVSLLRRLQIQLRLSMVHWLTWTGCGTPCCKYIPSPLLGDAPLRLRPPDLTPTWAAVKKTPWQAVVCT